MVVRGDTLLVCASGARLVLLGTLLTAACTSAAGQGNSVYDGGPGDASGRDGAGGTGGRGAPFACEALVSSASSRRAA